MKVKLEAHLRKKYNGKEVSSLQNECIYSSINL